MVAGSVCAAQWREAQGGEGGVSDGGFSLSGRQWSVGFPLLEMVNDWKLVLCVYRWHNGLAGSFSRQSCRSGDT